MIIENINKEIIRLEEKLIQMDKCIKSDNGSSIKMNEFHKKYYAVKKEIHRLKLQKSLILKINTIKKK